MLTVDWLLLARASLVTRLRTLRRRLRRVWCRHRQEVAAVLTSRHAVGLLCRRCDRRRVVGRFDSARPSAPATSDGVVVIDRAAYEALVEAYTVERAYADIGLPPW